jgi:hypothetical protein
VFDRLFSKRKSKSGTNTPRASCSSCGSVDSEVLHRHDFAQERLDPIELFVSEQCVFGIFQHSQDEKIREYISDSDSAIEKMLRKVDNYVNVGKQVYVWGRDIVPIFACFYSLCKIEYRCHH